MVVEEGAALYPPVSVILYNPLAVVAKSVTVAPETLPVIPNPAVKVIVPLLVQELETNAYLMIVPAVLSTTYRVSSPATELLKSAKKKAYGSPVEIGKPGRLVRV
jgi:hypothetical protein